MILKGKWPFVLLAFLSALYFASVVIPGRFATADEVFFKAAGRNWAQTGHFAAPEIEGRLKTGPSLADIYFAQPPIYTFLFGVFVKLVGFGPRVCIAYDLLIHLLLVWTGVILGRVVYGMDWNWAILVGVFLLPIGTIGRPDELGIVLAMVAAIAFRRVRRPWNSLAGGVALGFCLCTSLGAAVFIAPMLFVTLRLSEDTSAVSLASYAIGLFVSVFIATIIVSPILAVHPDAYKQLIAHAGEQSAVLSAATGEVRNSSAGLFQSWMFAARYGSGFVLWIVGLLLFAFICRFFGRTGVLPLHQMSAILFSLAILFFALPGKYTYLLFPGSWLLITCVRFGQEAWTLRYLPRKLLVAYGTFFLALSAIPFLRDRAILWGLPGDQRLTPNATRLRNEIPPGRGVMTTDFWWVLADRDRVYDANFSNPRKEEVAFIVLSGNGSGAPGKPLDFREEYKSGMQALDDRLNQTASHVGAIRISNSAFGFGPYVLVSK